MGDTKIIKPAYRLALLGAGRVGQTLGYLFRRRGHTVTAVISRTPAHARRAARFIGQGRPDTDADILNAVGWDVLMITTPDQMIAPSAQAIARYPLAWRTKIVLHCSGYHSSAALRPVADRGAGVGSMHPLQTFARPAQAIRDVQGSYFAIEGDARGLRAARRLVADLGGHAVTISTGDKTLYHCAAFLACGHLGALAGLSVSLLTRIGIPEAKAKTLLHPLMAHTIENLAHMPLAQAITGPISRGDIATVRAHLRALAETDPRALAIYKQLGNEMVDRLKGASLSAKDARALKKVLSDER